MPSSRQKTLKARTIWTAVTPISWPIDTEVCVYLLQAPGLVTSPPISPGTPTDVLVPKPNARTQSCICSCESRSAEIAMPALRLFTSTVRQSARATGCTSRTVRP